MRSRVLCIFFILFFIKSSFVFSQQANLANQKKFSVYKSSFNTNFTKEGIKGISLIFSCEYFFAEQEYAEMINQQKKTYFVFYIQLFNQNNEPVYYPFDYTDFSKAKSTTAVHFTAEDAYAPQVKSQGRRNTGIQLFIPFAHLDLPEGTHTLTATINAYSEKTGKKYENLYVEKINMSKPATYWAQLIPNNMVVFTKAGQKINLSQTEEDISALRGTNLKYPDIAGSGNASIKRPVSFVFSDGDVTYLRIHKNFLNTGKVIDYELPSVKTMDGKLVLNFDGKPQGDFLLDPNLKNAVIKNAFIDWNISIQKLKIPAVKLSQPKIKPFLTYKGMTGMSVGFDFEAVLPLGMPPLVIVPAYSKSDAEKQTVFKNGEIIAGKVELDTAGNIVLLENKNTIEIFYPFAGLVLNDQNVVLQKPNFSILRAKLQNTSSTITQKFIKQGFQVTSVRNAVFDPVVWAKDTIYKEERGLKINVPYKMPESYFGVIKKDFSIKITTGTPEDKGKFINMFRRTIIMNDNVQRLRLDTNDLKSISYKLLKANGKLDLFLPYTELGQQQPTALPFLLKILLNQNSKQKPVELGGAEALLKFDYDTKKIRLLTVGINNIKFKKPETGILVWKIISEKAVIYQSPNIAVTDKEVKNFYSQYYSIHEDDKVIVEVMKGADAKNLQLAMRWEISVKELSGEKLIELEQGKNGEIRDDNVKTVTLKYNVN